MLVKTRGIVFRSMKYRETSMIVDLYTESLGLQKAIINGVRSKSARSKANLFQVMSQLDLVMYYRDDRDLHRLREIRTDYIYQRVPFDVHRGAVGMFIVELARKTIRNSEQNESLYAFLTSTLVHLDQCTTGIANIHLHFLLELSEHLGFMPDTDYSADRPFFDMQEGIFTGEAPLHGQYLGPELAALLAQLQRTDLVHCHEVAMPRSVRHQLLDKFIRYYQLHIENLPPIHAHTILRDVF